MEQMFAQREEVIALIDRIVADYMAWHRRSAEPANRLSGMM